MLEIPLLGSLQSYKVATAVDGALLAQGPLFTVNKINKNGWGIPEDEAEHFAASFTGMPIRYCPKGVDTIAKDGSPIPAAHYCDAINSSRTIVGNIESVYPVGKDDENRTIYDMKARITDPKTVIGIKDGTIPASWSLWAYAAKESDDGMMRGCQGKSASIVSDPAYAEARFQWQAIAASAAPGLIWDINEQGTTMPDDKPENQTTLPGVTPVAAATGGITQVFNLGAAVSGDGTTDGKDGSDDPKPAENNAVCAKCKEPLPASAKFCPACGTSLHASCSNCSSTIPPGAKFCPSCGTPATSADGDTNTTVGDNSVAASLVDKLVEQKLAARLDQEKRQSLAASIAQVQVKTGVLQPTDTEKRITELIALPAATLETELNNYCMIADKLGKPVEQGMRSGQIPAAAAASTNGLPKIPMPANYRAILKQALGIDGRGMTDADILKYGIARTPAGVWQGSYHSSEG